MTSDAAEDEDEPGDENERCPDCGATFEEDHAFDCAYADGDDEDD